MKLTTEVPLKLQRFGETPRVLTGGRGGCRFFSRGGEDNMGANVPKVEFAKKILATKRPFLFTTRKVLVRKNPFLVTTRKIPDHKTSVFVP